MNTYPSVRMYTIFFVFWYTLWIHHFYIYVHLFFSLIYFIIILLWIIMHYHNYYWMILEYDISDTFFHFFLTYSQPDQFNFNLTTISVITQ